MWKNPERWLPASFTDRENTDTAVNPDKFHSSSVRLSLQRQAAPPRRSTPFLCDYPRQFRNRSGVDHDYLANCSTTDYYSNRPDAYASLVAVGKSDLPFLSVDPSMINCNNVELVPKADLPSKFDPAYGFEMKLPTVPEELAKRIISAIHNSPVVKPIIKKLLKTERFLLTDRRAP
jgi:hypothetical protein